MTVEDQVSDEDLTERPERGGRQEEVLVQGTGVSEQGPIPGGTTEEGGDQTQGQEAEAIERTQDEQAFVIPEGVTRDEGTGILETPGGTTEAEQQAAEEAQAAADAAEITEAPTEAEGDAYIDDLIAGLGL